MGSFRRILDSGEFFNEAYASLSSQLSKNSLLLGLASHFQFESGECAYQGIYGDSAPSPDNVYALVSLRKDLRTLVCSPSQNLDALFEIVDGCLSAGIKPDHCHSDRETANLLKVCFEERGFETKVVMSQGVYSCSKPAQPSGIEGLHLLKANFENHHGIAKAWAEAFYSEAMPHRESTHSASFVKERLDQGQLFLLHNNEDYLGMAAWARALPGAVSLNFIFVPPEFRSNGYGKAVTYLLTRHMLENEGFQEANLFTDIENEVSNGLYQSIGYVHLGFAEMFSISSS